MHDKTFISFIDSAPDAIIIVDGGGLITLVNHRTEKLFGYEHGDLIGQKVELLIPQEFLKGEDGPGAGFFKNLSVHPVGIELELFGTAKDGRKFPVEINLTTVELEDGTFISVSIRDITSRKRTEEKFKSLLDSASDAIVVVNDKGEIHLINRQTENLFGYSSAGLIGKKLELLMPVEFRDKHVHHRDTFFKQPHERPMAESLEVFGLHSDGTKFPAEISLTPLITSEGTFVSAAIRDITQRKKEELKFSKLLDSAPDAMVIVNDIGFIEQINRRTEELFGYKRAELIGQKVEMLMPREFHERHEKHRTGFFKDLGLRPFDTGIEFCGLHKDSTKFPVEISLSPLTTTEAMLVICDVSEKKKIKKDLTELNKLLQYTNIELESFSYSVSHDLREPLRHIIGFGEILNNKYADKLDEEGVRVLNKIIESAARMSKLIDELLNLSRLGTSTLNLQTVDINRILHEITSGIMSENGNKIDWHVDNFPYVNADKELIKVVLQNMVLNAVKYSRKRDKPSVKILNKTKPVGEYIFSVRDNGVGFDNKYKNKLFGVFQRLHRDDEFEGLGIGLATVKRIVQRHGGKLWAEGVVNEGAEFSFSLPRNDK